jgi:hypothetical protein
MIQAPLLPNDFSFASCSHWHPMTAAWTRETLVPARTVLAVQTAVNTMHCNYIVIAVQTAVYPDVLSFRVYPDVMS